LDPIAGGIGENVLDQPGGTTTMPEERRSIVISFAESGGNQCTSLPCLGHSPLPSERAAAEIQAVLEARRRDEQAWETEELVRLHARGTTRPTGIAEMMSHMETIDGHLAKDLAATSTYSTVRYQPHSPAHPSKEQLLDDPAAISETYGLDDVFELHEVRAAKVNFEIENRSDESACDVSVRMIVDTHDGQLIVVEHLPEQRQHEQDPTASNGVAGTVYPRVERVADRYLVSQDVGDLESGASKPAFREGLRIVLSNELAGRRIPFTIEVSSRDLADPIVSVLYGDATDRDTVD
jgi:hypothetical protein